MAVLRENVPLLDQCITLYAGHQTSDPAGKRWAQRRGFSPSSREALDVLGVNLGTATRVQFVVRFDATRPYLPTDTLVDADGTIWNVDGAALLGRRQFVLLYCTRGRTDGIQ